MIENNFHISIQHPHIILIKLSVKQYSLDLVSYTSLNIATYYFSHISFNILQKLNSQRQVSHLKIRDKSYVRKVCSQATVSHFFFKGQT